MRCVQTGLQTRTDCNSERCERCRTARNHCIEQQVAAAQCAHRNERSFSRRVAVRLRGNHVQHEEVSSRALHDVCTILSERCECVRVRARVVGAERAGCARASAGILYAPRGVAHAADDAE